MTFVIQFMNFCRRAVKSGCLKNQKQFYDGHSVYNRFAYSVRDLKQVFSSYHTHWVKNIFGFAFQIKNLKTIQGVRGQSGFFNWALTERNIQVKLYLKVVLKS